MKVQYKGEEYTLDADRAFDLGLLKATYKPKVGDVLTTQHGTIVILTKLPNGNWRALKPSLEVWHDPETTTEQLISGTAYPGFYYVGNISEQTKNLVERFK